MRKWGSKRMKEKKRMRMRTKRKGLVCFRCFCLLWEQMTEQWAGKAGLVVRAKLPLGMNRLPWMSCSLPGMREFSGSWSPLGMRMPP